jgi:hypothetical protein
MRKLMRNEKVNDEIQIPRRGVWIFLHRPFEVGVSALLVCSPEDLTVGTFTSLRTTYFLRGMFLRDGR